MIHHLTSGSLPAYPFIAEESGKTLQENPELRDKVVHAALPFLPHLAGLSEAQVRSIARPPNSPMAPNDSECMPRSKTHEIVNV